jgi:DNA modification methylase
MTVHYGYNSSLIKAAAKLYIPDGAVVADVTYGLGHFWTKTDTSRFTLLKSDISPRDPSVTRMDLRQLSYDNQSIDVVVLDPPYLHRTNAVTAEGKHRFDRAYNNAATTGNLSHDDIIQLYKEGMTEAWRVLIPGGTLWLKCKDEVENRQRFTHVELYEIAVHQGFRDQDLFVLISNSAPIHKDWMGPQVHARKIHSFMWVFKRSFTP